MPEAIAAPTEDQLRRVSYRRAMARKKRKERERAGEISELNLTAMMDMMTIILVFLLKSFSASNVAMVSGEDVRPPVSSTRLTPNDAVPVTITASSILVKEKEVVRLVDGAIPADQLEGRTVVALAEVLKSEVSKLRLIANHLDDAPFSGEMSVIADRAVPYQLLTTVLYTAGQAELDSYRFVVLQKEEPVAAAP